MRTTKIIPQRQVGRGRKWTECPPHQATRFALCRGIRILQTYQTMAAAKANLPSNSHEPIKPMTVGGRYKQDWRGTLTASLSQAQYLELKNRRLS